MVTAGDFRNGVTFEMDGNVYSIIEFQHVKPGKGAAFVRTKIRNVISGAVTEKTFNPNDKFPTAFIERKDMEYSYNDGDLPGWARSRPDMTRRTREYGYDHRLLTAAGEAEFERRITERIQIEHRRFQKARRTPA